MNGTFDRYVNNDLISYISRPQYENSCSFTALTAVFNYFYADKLGIKTSNELASAIGIKAPKNITGYGNSQVMIAVTFYGQQMSVILTITHRYSAN